LRHVARGGEAARLDTPGLLESQSIHPAFVAVLGGLLALGRVLHAEALGKGNLKLRVRGMILTFGALGALAIMNIAFPARAWL